MPLWCGYQSVALCHQQDWENVARDLQTLGFIPLAAGDPVQLRGLVPALGSILSQLSGGGGAAKLNIDAVMGELEDLGRLYPFSIPPFFTLILRAFSVIEGIALGVDPDYAIVQVSSCGVVKRFIQPMRQTQMMLLVCYVCMPYVLVYSSLYAV